MAVVMNDIDRPRKIDERVFPLLWFLIALKTLLPWLVFFRLTFEGNSYEWGTTLFGRTFYSAGLTRLDFLLIYVLLSTGIFLLYHLRNFNFRIAAPVVLLYFAVFAVDALYNLALGEPIIFQGDTLGVNINISIPFFIFHFAALALAVTWWWGVRRDSISRSAPALTPARAVVVKFCIAFIPVQLILLIFGEPHGTTDAVGVIGTLLQGALLAWALYPGAKYRST